MLSLVDLGGCPAGGWRGGFQVALFHLLGDELVVFRESLCVAWKFLELTLARSAAGLRLAVLSTRQYWPRKSTKLWGLSVNGGLSWLPGPNT